MMDCCAKKLSKQTFEHAVARILTHVIRSWLFIGPVNETNQIWSFHIRFGPKSKKDSNLRFFSVWPRSDKVCTPISGGVLRHSWSPFFLIVPRREILAESFPGARSPSDNTDWSCLCFRIRAAKTCTEAAATWSCHHSACALLHPSTLPVCSGNTPVSTARWLQNDTVHTHTSTAHPRCLVYLH